MYVYQLLLSDVSNNAIQKRVKYAMQLKADIK